MNKKLCNCKYYEYCHEPRQKIQIEYRKATGKNIEQCIFYKKLMILYKDN